MKYHFDLRCPRCGKLSAVVVDEREPAPVVNCGDCLMNDVEITTMVPFQSNGFHDTDTT